MQFQSIEYNEQVVRLRRAPNVNDRARGDNFAFEENVGPDRRAHFEQFSPGLNDLRKATARYFDRSVQGTRRSHVPSTFQDINRPALLPVVPELVQKIVRLERIEPRRVSRRPHFLRGWGHHDEASISQIRP